MGNNIDYASRPDLPTIQMNNGLMSVVVSVLCLGASELATTDEQRELAAWLASRDQGVFGLGMVGFALEAMPWHPPTLEADRAFLLAAIDAARAKTGWDRLGYRPHEAWVDHALARLDVLVRAFDVAHASCPAHWFGDEPPARWERCAVHGVYVHAFGCVICNDA